MSPRPRRVKDAHKDPDPAGPTVRTTASVAPATAERLGKAVAERRRQVRAKESRPRSTVVEVVAKAHPELEAYARELVRSGHGYTRVEVVSATEVLVR